MSSTLKSNDDSNILEVKNFSISYNVPYYKAHNLRDVFIAALSSPVDFFLMGSDKVIVLDHINLTLKKGERLGILGNNGCGKTSLCRYISGIFGDHKKIKLNGKVKAIFDTEVAVLPELSGRENLEVLSLLFYPECTKEEREKIIQDTIEFCDLGKYIDVPFKLYSKGMRARLFLSLVSSKPSDLLILDEVFSGADLFFSEKMSKRIKEVIENSKSVIFITHSMDLLTEVCNRAIVLDNKKIVFDGSPDEAIVYYKSNCARTEIQGH